MRHILIVANQTVASEHLKRTIQGRMLEGECRFTLVVPASQPYGTFVWTEGQARANAADRLEKALAELRAIGASIEGVVGDPRPMLAVDDAMREDLAEEIIVSTLPPGASRWLRQDLPHRLAREYNVKVTHVVDSTQAAIA
ncbi:MAG: hypothetical protein ACYDCC_10275 [Actinomycetota bacterium]